MTSRDFRIQVQYMQEQGVPSDKAIEAVFDQYVVPLLDKMPRHEFLTKLVLGKPENGVGVELDPVTAVRFAERAWEAMDGRKA